MHAVEFWTLSYPHWYSELSAESTIAFRPSLKNKSRDGVPIRRRESVLPKSCSRRGCGGGS